MPLGRETVGEAYVRIIADTSSLKGDVERALSAEAASLERAGEKAGDDFGRGVRKSFRQNQGLGGAILHDLEQQRGEVGGIGTLLGDDFAKRVVAASQRHFADDPIFGKQVGERLASDLENMARRGQVAMQTLDDGTKVLSRDLRGPLLDAERAVRAEMEKTATTSALNWARDQSRRLKEVAAAEKAAADEAKRMAAETEKLRAGDAAKGVQLLTRALKDQGAILSQREVSKLTADFKSFITASEQARVATTRLNTALRSGGLTERDVAEFAKANKELDKFATSLDNAGKSAQHSGMFISGDLTRNVINLLKIIGPAALPIIAGLTGALVGAAGAAGVAALAFYGVYRNMQQGTALGRQYTQALLPIRTELQALSNVAARGILPGFTTALSAAVGAAKPLTAEVALLSGQLGIMAGNIGQGLVNMLVQLAPLFNQVAAGMTNWSARFLAWTQSASGFQQFVAYMQHSLPQVLQLLGALATTIGHAAQAFAPFGGIALSSLTAFLNIINSIPVPLLQVAAGIYEVVRISSLMKGAWTWIATLGPQIEQLVAKVLALAAANQAAAASAGGVGGAIKGIGTAAATSAGGLTIFLTALTLGTLALGNWAAHLSDAFNKMPQSVKDFGQAMQIALTQSNGALDDNVNKTIIAQLQQQKWIDSAQKAGVSIDQLATAMEKGGVPLDNLLMQMQQYGGLSDRNVHSIEEMSQAIQDQQKQVHDMTAAQDRLNQAYLAAHPAEAAMAQQAGLSASAYRSAAQAMEQAQLTAQKNLDLQKLQIASNYQLMGTQQQLATTYGITAQQVQTYAATLGITQDQVTKNTIQAQTYSQAVSEVANAQRNATQSQSAWLDALNTFVASGKSAADTAKLIGATLVAANGDALGFAATMNASAVATADLATQVGKSAAKFVNAKTGLIDYTKAGAQPLIQGMQALQTAAMNAAEATYQHEKATRGGAQAAKDAIQVYQTGTVGALKAQQQELGLTDKQVQALSQQYFGLPKDIQTKLELLGTDPTLTALNQIGELLAQLTHQTWKTVLDANATPAVTQIDQLQSAIDAIQQHKVPNLNADNGEGKLVVQGLQQAIDAIAQHRPPTLNANSQQGLAVILAMQHAIDAIRQGRVPGLTADNAPGRQRIAVLQQAIDAISQHREPTLTVNTTAAEANLARVNYQLSQIQDKTVEVNVRTNYIMGANKIGAGGGGAGGNLGQQAGGIISQDQLVRVGENNKKEAIVPLERPLNLINPVVRPLAEFARGIGANRPANQFNITVNSLQSPTAVAQQVINRAVALARI